MPEETRITGTRPGRPDYLMEQYDVFTGVLGTGYRLKPSEKYKLFYRGALEEPSIYPWMISPLSPGSSISLMDVETGLTTYTVPEGYRMWYFGALLSVNQDMKVVEYMDDQPYSVEFAVGGGYLRAVETTLSVEEGKKVEARGTNIGTGNLEGFGRRLCILRPISTQLFDKKTVICQKCDDKEEVSLRTTEFKCPKCGTANSYSSLRWGDGTQYI